MSAKDSDQSKETILISEKYISVAREIIIVLLHKKDLRKILDCTVKMKAIEILKTWPERLEKEVRLLERLVICK